MTENIDPNVGSINLLVQSAFDDDDFYLILASPKKLIKIEGDILLLFKLLNLHILYYNIIIFKIQGKQKTLKEIKFKELAPRSQLILKKFYA